MKTKINALQLTHDYLRERAMLIAKTEHYDYYGGRRKDLFGFVDTIALNPTTVKDVLFIQSTSDSNRWARRNKILANPHLPIILRHVRVEVWSWKERAGSTPKRKLWRLRRDGFKLHDDGATVSTYLSTDPLY